MSLPQFTDKERQVAIALAREDLYTFARWMFINRRRAPWIRGPHHAQVCDALMRVYLGEIQNLIINIPPRYSKTELAVVAFIAWTMGRHPDAEFIHTSYSATLAGENSAEILDMVRHPAYREIFPEFNLATEGKDHWKTKAGGALFTTGSGGTMTGFGAGRASGDEFGGAMVIDDPHKADEARSKPRREFVTKWYQNTVQSRRNDPRRTPTILIMQRLHEEDLSGWLLNGGSGEHWEHLCLSAINDDGTALWPEKHDIGQLLTMQRAMPYMFAGQYRQAPSPLEGGIFKPDQIQIVDAVPARATFVRGWDFGSTVNGDATAGLLLGVLLDGRYVIADLAHDHLGPDERDAMLMNVSERDSHGTLVSIPQDPGQAGKTQVKYLTRQLAGKKVHSSPESGDKVVRAEPFAAQVNVGNVLMVRAPWNQKVIDEMQMFPNGSRDDIIDAGSRAFAGLLEHRNRLAMMARAVGRA